MNKKKNIIIILTILSVPSSPAVLSAVSETSIPPEGMVLIPAATFSMGSEKGLASERPVHKVTLDSFYLDRCLVTNRQYLSFCNATKHPVPPAPKFSGMADYLEKFPGYPVVGVTWQDAEAYARWCGKRLPTEAEWEYAARGGLSDKNFPWGDGLPSGYHANFAGGESLMEWREINVDDGYPYTSPVEHFTPNRFGLYDMAGNVWQWCSDWYEEEFYRHSPAENPRGPQAGIGKVTRGGCWYSPVFDLRCSRRIQQYGWPGVSSIGFRCARNLHATKVVQPIKPASEPSIKPKRPITVAQGMELTFGNDADEASAKLYRSLGVTSIESYVTWESVERNGEGQWDFSQWDRQVEILKKYGLKWVPFLIAGCAYATPDWFRESDRHYPSVCLEHQMPSKIQSIWNPAVKPYIEKFIAKFAERYRHSGVIESVLLGVTGDFGEVLYPVWGGGWTFIIPGVYHVHLGFWCAEEYAHQAFHKYALQCYGDVTAVNAAWGTQWYQESEIDFPPLSIPDKSRYIIPDEGNGSGVPFYTNAQDRRRWLDFMLWYRQSLTDWADWWLATTRSYFPAEEIYLCTGGNAHPAHGSDFSAQCKAAARYGAGVRITNEASNYAENFYLTRWVASAGQFYNAFFGFEPAGGVDENGVVARIYNATASGARQLHYYAGNVTASQPRIDRFEQNAHMLFPAQPIVPLALFYPNADLTLNWTWIDHKINHFRERSAWLRDAVDHDYVDEIMATDGALDQYRYLFVADSGYFEQETLQRIDDWLHKGGTLICLAKHRMLTVSGDDGYFKSWFPEAFGVHPVDKGRTVALDALWENRADLFGKLAKLFTDDNQPLPDGIEDGVFVTRLKNGMYLYNSTDRPVVKQYQDGKRQMKKSIPAHTIVLQQ